MNTGKSTNGNTSKSTGKSVHVILTTSYRQCGGEGQGEGGVKISVPLPTRNAGVKLHVCESGGNVPGRVRAIVGHGYMAGVWTCKESEDGTGVITPGGIRIRVK